MLSTYLVESMNVYANFCNGCYVKVHFVFFLVFRTKLNYILFVSVAQGMLVAMCTPHISQHNNAFDWQMGCEDKFYNR